MANSCAVCGEPLHSGRCIDVLRRALRLVRSVDKAVDFDFVAHPVNVHLSTIDTSTRVQSTNVDTPSVDKREARKAYQREWLRRRRAQHA